MDKLDLPWFYLRYVKSLGENVEEIRKIHVFLCFNFNMDNHKGRRNALTHSHTMTPFDAPGKHAF